MRASCAELACARGDSGGRRRRIWSRACAPGPTAPSPCRTRLICGPDESLEHVRLADGECLDKRSPFALVLAGRPLLRERLSEPRHHALAQRITVRARRIARRERDRALLEKHMR